MNKIILSLLKSSKLIFGLFLFLTLSCSKNLDEAKTLVNSSVKAHGGQKNYDALKAVSFIKTTRLFLEDGSIESEVVQKQSFQLKPDYRVLIEWSVKDNKHVIFYDGKKAIKTINSEVVGDYLEAVKATNTAKAASYVFFQPFELLNDNTILKIEEDIELNDSVSTSVVSVKYKNDTQNSDKWRYYFNEDNLLVANSVVLTDHNSLIENLEFQSVSGLIFNKYRKSYRVDKDLNKRYLRAEYFYDELQALF